MVYVWLDYSDGRYTTRRLESEQAANEARAKGCTVVVVEDRVWEAWQAWIAQGRVFETMWRLLDDKDRDDRERYAALATRAPNSCGRECYVVGGPFIGPDPDCPDHGRNR